MRPEDAWNQFVKTGAVSDYMQYRRASMLLRHLQDESEDEMVNADQNEGDHPEGTGQWRRG